MAATKLNDRICKNCNISFKGWNCNTICSTECSIKYNLLIKERNCKICNITKSIDEFYIMNFKTKARKLHCDKCEQNFRKIRIANNPNYDKQIEANRKKKWGKLYPERLRNSRLKYVYGIDTAQYEEILNKQNNVCAICLGTEVKVNKETNTLKKLAVDHCHETGKVRGLLCFHCNSSLGKMKDSIELLERAIEYLKKSREEQ